MSKRSYRQNCALAIALDLVGERWTLLIARELLIAPRRYRDLLDNLPGIGTNLLAERLARMSALGLVEKTGSETPHAPYGLTELGRTLEPVVEALVRFGMQFSDRRSDEFASRSEWNLLPLRFYFRPAAADWSGAYELWLDDAPYTLRSGAAGLEVSEGQAANALATIRMSARAAASIAGGEQTVSDVLQAGELTTEGDDEAIQAFFGAFGQPD